MTGFKQGGSKFQEYMKELIHKIHEAEEMLLSGDERHLEDLKEIAENIEQYVREAEGHKFEPMGYQQMQGNPQGAQAWFDRRGEYGEFPMSRGTRSAFGYVPYPYYYPFFNEEGGNTDGRDRSRGSRSAFNQGGGQGGSSGGSSGGSQGYSSEFSNRRGR